MNRDMGSLGMAWVWLLAAGAAVLGLLVAARFVLDLLPMSKARRAALSRLRPVAGLVLLVAYVLYAARLVFGDRQDALPLVVGLVVTGLALASWSTLRDLLSGVSVKAGRVCQLGDHVRIGNVEGRVARMGYRVVVVETARGDEAIIPYGRLIRDTVVRTHSPGGFVPHEFRLELPARLGHTAACEVVREAALTCHWSAISRDPELSFTGDTLDVTVFSLDAEHGPEIEATVRAALKSRASQGARSSVSPPS